MGSYGELLARRTLAKNGASYVPGQTEVRIIDPYPHRDLADIAAILTYVDDEGVLFKVTCLRYRDERGWKAITVDRCGVRRPVDITLTAAALGYELSAEHLAAIEASSAGTQPFVYEEPPEDEKRIRRIANKLLDDAEDSA